MRARLGAYELVASLKSGGMGDVLLGRRHGPGGFEQLAAVKTIRPELASSSEIRTMFLDEARLLARLSHPAIAQVHDFGEEDGTLYLAMEFVRGLRVKELVGRRAPPAVLARVIAEACRGLHAAHELRDLGGASLGVVHRDISPDNLMLGFDGQVKVLDFGIALVRGRMAVTEHGTVKGKPPYMSPEQVRGRPLDRRSDVFSVGVVLHELLTGRRLFDGEHLYAVARAVVDDAIAPPSAHAGALPVGLDDAVLAALVREPDGRIPTAAALAERLERIAGAAGGESLAGWAAHALADDAERHRAWLAGLLGGAAARPGRASGVVTAPAMPRVPAPVVAEAPGGTTRLDAAGAQGAGAPAEQEPLVETTPPVAPTSATSLPPARGRRGVVVAVGVAAVGLAAATWRWASPHRAPSSSPVAAAPPDAAPRAAPTPGPDAAPPGAAPDAASASPPPRAADEPRRVGPRDPAPQRRALPPDPVPERPASPPPPPERAPPPPERAPLPDAAPAAVVGKGYLTVNADPFLLVRVDGRDWGATPVLRRALPAGPHEVELRRPDTGEVVLRRTVRVVPGGHERLAP